MAFHSCEWPAFVIASPALLLNGPLRAMNLTAAGGSFSAKLSSGDARHPIAHFGYEMGATNVFDRAVIVIDEVHNLVAKASPRFCDAFEAASVGNTPTPPTHTHTTTYPPTHTHYAFAAILDPSVVTWGYVRSGGDSSAVRDQLKGVQHIQATASAFAAILVDGSVVTWGDADRGGDSWAVRDQLRFV